MAAHGEDTTKPFDNSTSAVLVYDAPLSSATRSDREEFICKLCTVLENDTPVLVQGWNPQLLCQHDTFEDIVLSYFGKPGSIVTWQCWSPLSVSSELAPDHPNNIASHIQFQKENEEKELKIKIKTARGSKAIDELEASLQKLQEERAQIHETSCLDEFLQDAKDPNKCGNVLDRMNISSSEWPWFIRFVGSSFQNFTVE